jgi:hypothetical protein
METIASKTFQAIFGSRQLRVPEKWLKPLPAKHLRAFFCRQKFLPPEKRLKTPVSKAFEAGFRYPKTWRYRKKTENVCLVSVSGHSSVGKVFYLPKAFTRMDHSLFCWRVKAAE